VHSRARRGAAGGFHGPPRSRSRPGRRRSAGPGGDRGRNPPERRRRRLHHPGRGAGRLRRHLDEAEFTDDDAELEEIDDSDDNDELDDAPDEFQPEVEWAEATEDEDDEVEASVEDALEGDEIEGLNEVRDADSVEGGEDDFTNFQSRKLSDEQLDELGYDGQRSPRTRSD
jgi:hypothetical protein